jgi:metal-responsive CopG/Arc/MetJ family transcriptional regulator
MAVKKIAISIPVETLSIIDKIAAKVGNNRSKLITSILNYVAKNIQDKEITQQINKVFSDKKIQDEQRDTMKAYLELVDDLEATKW